MKHQITKTNLVRDIYDESSYLEKMAIQQARKKNNQIDEEYKNLKKAQDILNSSEIEPPQFLIQNILDYSKSSEFETKT
ncbi:MAG: hypothetical protein MK207_04335 [Saprospiraceae bacterium]|nr:hypothetical protein [Saprospiraceae bacterium]